MFDFMDNLAKKYIKWVLPSVKIGDEKPLSIEGLPLAYRGMYEFRKCLVDGEMVVIAYVKGVATGPKEIKLHQKVLKDKGIDPIIWVFEKLHSHKANRLISNGINFIILNKQVNLPFMYLSMKKTYEKKGPKKIQLNPLGIRILTREVVAEDLNNLNHTEIGTKLGESPLSIGRALERIFLNNLASQKRNGNAMHVSFLSRGEIISYLKSNLYSPVESEFFVQSVKGLPLAGESLLAEETMLVSGEIKTFAVYKKDMFEYMDFFCDDPEDADAKIQVWRWNPRLYQGEDRVDPIGLYFSLKGIENERVQICLDEFLTKYQLEGLKWSPD